MTNHDDQWDDDERQALDAVRAELEALGDRYRNALPIDLARASRAGALPEDVDERVRTRLDGSAWERALVEGADAADPVLEAAAADRMLSRIRRETATTRRPLWARAWVWGPALAAAAIGVAVAVFMPPGMPSPASVGARASASPVGGHEAAAYHLPLDKPDVRFTAAALVLRGHAASERFVDVVAPAVAAYRANDYSAAARDFAALQDRYPASVEVVFYLGISRLFTGDWSGAIEALRRAKSLGDESFGPEASWYLAIAYDREGRRADARLELDRLCRGGSSIASRACQTVPELK